MRRDFHPLLLQHMRADPRIWLIVPDLGYGMMDAIFAEFPDRAFNVGAAEQLAMGVAVGLAEEGKIPVVYSITPFLLWRAAEWLRNYVNHEQVPIRLLAAGRDQDYAHDGFTHDASDDVDLLQCFPNIECYWPETVAELPEVTREWLFSPRPSYLNLRR